MNVFPSASSRRRGLLWVGAGLLAAAYLALAAFHVAYGTMNVDEGFYAVAARAVWQGEMPYRDFGFTQPPLVAYVNAPFLALTRFGLFPQRVLNGVWGALAVLLAVRLVRRRAGAGAAFTLAASFTVTSGWLYFIHLGKTYGLTSLLVMGMAVVYVEMGSGWKKSTLLSVLAVLGTASRLPAAPFFGLIWLGALGGAGRPAPRSVGIALASLLVSGAVVWLPFLFAAPEQTRFWVIDFHRTSVPLKDWHVPWADLVGLAPAVWLAALLAVGALAWVRPGWKRPELAVAAAALLTLAANLLPGGAYQEYGVPFLLPLAASSLILFEPVASRWPAWRRGLMTGVFLALAVGLVPALGWNRLTPAQRRFPSMLLPAKVPPYDFNLPESIASARVLVQRGLPPGRPFLGPAIILAVEADRPVPRRFRMGPFTCTRDFDEAKADRLHLATLPEFLRQIRDTDAPILGFHPDIKFNYAWSVPSFDYQLPEIFVPQQAFILRQFQAGLVDRNFVIMVRRPPPRPGRGLFGP